MNILIQEYIAHLGLYKVQIDDYHYQVQAYMSAIELEELPAVENPEFINKL